jgi:hypothetical protein
MTWLALLEVLDQVVAVRRVLDENPNATVKLVAKEISDEIREHEDFNSLVNTYGPISKQPRLEIASGDGYGELKTGGEGVMTGGTVTAEGYVNTLGRGGQASPIIEDLLRRAKHDGHEVTGQLLWNDDGEYLGYRITIVTDAGSRSFDVTGAASRFLPDGGCFGDEQRDLVMASPRNGGAPSSGARDAPPEGGNFDGGFAASATQAARYGRHARREREAGLAGAFVQSHGGGFLVDLAELPESQWAQQVVTLLAGELKVDPDRVRVARRGRTTAPVEFTATLGGVDLGRICKQP